MLVRGHEGQVMTQGRHSATNRDWAQRPEMPTRDELRSLLQVIQGLSQIEPDQRVPIQAGEF